jgi:hypothetical protein
VEYKKRSFKWVLKKIKASPKQNFFKKLEGFEPSNPQMIINSIEITNSIPIKALIISQSETPKNKQNKFSFNTG